jgi:SAM-dependent methyltransferase
MALTRTLIVPFDSQTAAAARAMAVELSERPDQIIFAGPHPLELPSLSRLRAVSTPGEGKGLAIREALAHAEGDVVVLHDALPCYSTSEYSKLIQPLEADTADGVFGRRSLTKSSWGAAPELALGQLARWVADVDIADGLCGLRAFRTAALRSVPLKANGDDIDAEIFVKLAAQKFRFSEVALEHGPLPWPAPAALEKKARALIRYALLENDTDNSHEGYNTLIRMEAAGRYNGWVGRKFRPHLGPRVLEVGAGIGTMTSEIETGRELLVALEVDSFYLQRLRNRFRNKPHIVPYLSDDSLTNLEARWPEGFDSVVLSNVLEHIEDDVEAVKKFYRVLAPGGALLILVPALNWLYGAMDEAVGHHRRYSKPMLRKVLEDGGFEVERLEWMNALGIPGWLLNGRILRRRTVPPLQLQIYDVLSPLWAEAESRLPLPIGMSLFAVARKKRELQ